MPRLCSFLQFKSNLFSSWKITLGFSNMRPPIPFRLPFKWYRVSHNNLDEDWLRIFQSWKECPHYFLKCWRFVFLDSRVWCSSLFLTSEARSWLGMAVRSCIPWSWSLWMCWKDIFDKHCNQCNFEYLFIFVLIATEHIFAHHKN